MNKLSLVLAATALLSACTVPEASTETTATGTTTGTSTTTATCEGLLIDEVTVPTCSGNTWNYNVVTSCWAGMVDLDVTQNTASPWEEYHVLDSVERFTLEEEFGLSLPVTDDFSSQESSVNSLYKCDDVEAGRSDTLTWTFYVYDVDGYYTDCVVMGADPTVSPDCANANDW